MSAAIWITFLVYLFFFFKFTDISKFTFLKYSSSEASIEKSIDLYDLPIGCCNLQKKTGDGSLDPGLWSNKPRPDTK